MGFLPSIISDPSFILVAYGYTAITAQSVVIIKIIFNRVNGAIIQGFEDDVGTKTSFYGFTTNSLKNSLVGYHEDGFDKVPRDSVFDPLFHN